MKSEALQIDLIYDIICPWCYIGHERLLKAIERTNTKVQIQLLPYQIRPHIDVKGMDVQEYYKSKGITDIAQAYEKVKQAAEDEGLLFEPLLFSKIPNTLKIHQVILKAEKKGKGVEVLHAIQTAYFGYGMDLTKLDTIIKIVKDYITEEEVKLAWVNADDKNLVLSREQNVKNARIHTVPTYIIDQKHRISGAISNYTMIDMLNQLAPKNIIGDYCDIETGVC